jgi:hypothetical protein
MPGSDLLSRVLRRSTIGAEAFNGRVRNGIGFGHFAIATRQAKSTKCKLDLMFLHMAIEPLQSILLKILVQVKALTRIHLPTASGGISHGQCHGTWMNAH